MSFANLRDPVTLVRSPTLTKTPPGCGMVWTWSPDRRVLRSMTGMVRGATPATASAIERTWAGVVPQQPPAMLISPSRAYAPRSSAVVAGPSS